MLAFPFSTAFRIRRCNFRGIIGAEDSVVVRNDALGHVGQEWMLVPYAADPETVGTLAIDILRRALEDAPDHRQVLFELAKLSSTRTTNALRARQCWYAPGL